MKFAGYDLSRKAPRRWTAATVTVILLTASALGCRNKIPQPEEDTDIASASLKPTAEIVAQHNRGMALMGQFEYVAAHDVFEALVAQHPESADLNVDLAITKLNRRLEGDTQAAAELLLKTISEHPDSLRARFCYGLLLSHEGRSEEALQMFQFVLERDSRDAYAAYYAGQCLLDQSRPADALTMFQDAQRHDPTLRSAYYGAFQACQRLGQNDEAQQNLAMFQKLATHPQARLAEMKYSRMGPKADVAALAIPGPDSVTVDPNGALFLDGQALQITVASAAAGTDFAWSEFLPANRSPGITLCDINADGLVDIFITQALKTAGSAVNAVLLQAQAGHFELVLDHPLAAIDDINAVLWGDFDNDGQVDAYFCRRGPNQLWQQGPDQQWVDVTASAGVAHDDYNTVDGAMFDADHDGDLDLFVLNADGPNELFSNNLDGTFRPLAEQYGLQGKGGHSTGIVLADLDADRDVDIIIINRETPHDVYLNDRLWSYHQPTGWSTFQSASIWSAVATDIDADGQLDLVTTSELGLALWKPDAIGEWTARTVPLSDLKIAPGPLAVQDLSGDGRLEIVVTTTRGWAVLRPSDTPAILAEYSIDDARASTSSFVLAAFDPTRGFAMLTPQSGQAPIIHQPGAHRFAFTGIQFTGRESAADQMRSNASGIGILAAARVGSRWTHLQSFRDQSGPGQSRQPLLVGLGKANSIDFVSLLWPDGLLQTELQLDAGKVHTIEETQRQVSSCPVLFVWDGQQMQFVTDILGVGGIGFNLANGVYAEPRPRESLLLAIDPTPDENGDYVIAIGEPMEEACYLDSIRLVAYDLPPGWNVSLDERQAITGPIPTGRPIFFREQRNPARFTTATGEDVTVTMRDVDGKAVGPTELDPRFVGRASPYSLIMHFDMPLDVHADRYALLIDGWIEYPYSQTMFAAWQADAAFEAPTLEASGDDGVWYTIHANFGYPAGMPRQMSLPIDANLLPPGTTRLRLTTNMEIYWDRIVLVRPEPCPDVVQTELVMTSAEVCEVGFAHRLTLPQKRPQYDYTRRVPLWDTRHQAGYYSQFGDVGPLVEHTDDAVAIFGPGEEIRLAFVASLPPSRPGWTRRFVLEAAGWCKDMDLYTRDGETIEPLPRNAERRLNDSQEMRREELHRQYNQRYRAG